MLQSVKRLSEEASFDYLVIESTGISEPLPVAQTFVMDVDGHSHGASQPRQPHEVKSLSNFARLDTLVTVNPNPLPRLRPFDPSLALP